MDRVHKIDFSLNGLEDYLDDYDYSKEKFENYREAIIDECFEDSKNFKLGWCGSCADNMTYDFEVSPENKVEVYGLNTYLVDNLYSDKTRRVALGEMIIEDKEDFDKLLWLISSYVGGEDEIGSELRNYFADAFEEGEYAYNQELFNKYCEGKIEDVDTYFDLLEETTKEDIEIEK